MKMIKTILAATAILLSSCGEERGTGWVNVEIVAVHEGTASWDKSYTIVKGPMGLTRRVGGVWGKPGDMVRLNTADKAWNEMSK